MFTFLQTPPLTPPSSPPLPLRATPQRRPSLLRSPFQLRRSRSAPVSSLKTSDISRPLPLPERQYTFASGRQLLDLQRDEPSSVSFAEQPPLLPPLVNDNTSSSQWPDTLPITPKPHHTKRLLTPPPRPPRNPARRFSLPALPSFASSPPHPAIISRPILNYSYYTPPSSTSSSSSSSDLGLVDVDTLLAFPLPPYRTAPLPPSHRGQLPFSQEQRILASPVLPSRELELGKALELLEGKRPRRRPRKRGGDWAVGIPEEGEEEEEHVEDHQQEKEDDSPLVSPDLQPLAPPFEFDAPEWKLDGDDSEQFPATPELELEGGEEDRGVERKFYAPSMGAWGVDEEEMEDIRFAEDEEGEADEWEAKSLLELYLY